MSGAKITFITGTDTGVGKTVVTALILKYLRETGVHACAMKPISSGSRSDGKILRSLEPELTLQQVNPFHFSSALAPLIAARKARRWVPLKTVLDLIRELHRSCGQLLVEGAGGLLSPLGPDYTSLDLIKHLKCDVVIVAPNRLGTINHCLLTVTALQGQGRFKATRRKVSLVLVDLKTPDSSASSNATLIAEVIPDMTVRRLPYLGTNPLRSGMRIPRTIPQLVLA